MVFLIPIMSKSLSQRVVYERLLNGMDVYILPGSAKDVVMAELALPLGTHTVYERPYIAILLSMVFPGSTKKSTRTEVLHTIERLGGQVSARVTERQLIISIASRRQVFGEVLRVVVHTLTQPLFPPRECRESLARFRTALVQAQENTSIRAREALAHALYRKGHPHWEPGRVSQLRALPTVVRKDMVQLYHDAYTTIGASLCVVGDVDPNAIQVLVEEVCGDMPHGKGIEPVVHPDRVVGEYQKKDHVVSIRDKINVDTFLGIPTTITRNDGAYHALMMGVAILGGSSTSRLFHTLRSRNSLTYGAYATIRGVHYGYPGYIEAHAVFPHDVFIRGLPALRQVVSDFIEGGITPKELAARKVELQGFRAVGMSTTRGLLGVLTQAVYAQQPLSYLDEYPAIIDAITRTEVHAAIKEYLLYDRAVTVAAGSIDAQGMPL